MKASSNPHVIHVPIQDVFTFISTIENMDAWVSGVHGAKPLAPGETHVGQPFASKYDYGKKTHDIEYVVTHYDAPHRYGCKATAGPFPFESLIELREVNGGTEIVNTIDAGSDSRITDVIFALFGPLLRKAMTKRLDGELVELKAMLEKELVLTK